MTEPDNGLSTDDATALAEEIVAVVADLENVTLDYSVDSLNHVDRVIGGFHEEGVPIDEVEATIFRFGCYVGEVFVRNAGAAWRVATQDELENIFGVPLVIDLPDGSTANPIGKALKRLQNGEEDNLPYFYEVFTQPQSKSS